MKLQAFSLRDTKAEVFAAPFFVPNENIARRLVGRMLQDHRSDLAQYPADFMLYSVGTYNTENAALISEQVELVCSVSSLLPKDNPAQLRIPGTEQNIEVPA